MAWYEGLSCGQYQLLSLLGKGGFAEVYLGQHRYLGTQAAVKLLHTRLGEEDQRRFLNEARLIAHLVHPHIVRVLDFGLEEGVPYLVMDYAPLGSVRQLYVPSTEVQHIAALIGQVADALQHAHNNRIVHRDVKPDNILLKSAREALLSDFGIAVAVQSAQLSPMDVAGTADYTPHEQLEGRPCPASDQYALGIVAYEWIAGQRPFRGSVAELYVQHREVPPPPLRAVVADVPPAVEQVIFQALAKDPTERFACVRDFGAALAQAAGAAHAGPVVLPTAPLRSERQGDQPMEGTRPWNVPSHRNPYFTGREEVLALLHDVLATGQAAQLTQPQAISGLGGVGKTQTAVEYAYRYRGQYQAVLWACAETHETLVADCIALAGLLDLPEKDEQDTGRVLAAVKSWLETHTGWLLVLDNVEEFPVVRDVLPCRGSILLTTRSQLTGSLSRRVDLEEMQPEEGALFLMRRAQLVDLATPYGAVPLALRVKAKEISELLNGLPLALDQAGAYIEETGGNLSDYLEQYLACREELLGRRGMFPIGHPESVATTWSLSFERVESANPAAADLLRFCSLLAPDVIPEEIFSASADDLGPHLGPAASDPMELEEAIRELRKYSLLRRDPLSKTLSIHRLVQAVLRDALGAEEQRIWAERAVRAINLTFPGNNDEVALWFQSQRCLPQVQNCAALVDEFGLLLPEAAALLNRAGNYLLDQAHYTLAEVFLRKSIGVRTILLGTDHPDVAECLNDLAVLHMLQKEYAKAEPLLRRASAMYERQLGPYDHIVAVATNNVAMLCFYQKRYAEAEPLYQRSIAIWEHLNWPEHPDVARCLNNLALLYASLGKYAEAEPLYQRSIAIWERIQGPKHPDAARCLNNLARLYAAQGNSAEAEPRFLRARAIREQLLGSDHPDVAQTLGDLARLYTGQARYDEAEDLFHLALEIIEQALGPEHTSVAEVQENYASLLRLTNRESEADTMITRSWAIRAKQAAGT